MRLKKQSTRQFRIHLTLWRKTANLSARPSLIHSLMTGMKQLLYKLSISLICSYVYNSVYGKLFCMFINNIFIITGRLFWITVGHAVRVSSSFCLALASRWLSWPTCYWAHCPRRCWRWHWVLEELNHSHCIW